MLHISTFWFWFPFMYIRSAFLPFQSRFEFSLVYRYYNFPLLETIITGSSDKNYIIVTVVAIILVTAGILISVYNFRNKGQLFINNVVLFILFVWSSDLIFLWWTEVNSRQYSIVCQMEKLLHMLWSSITHYTYLDRSQHVL